MERLYPTIEAFTEAPKSHKKILLFGAIGLLFGTGAFGASVLQNNSSSYIINKDITIAFENTEAAVKYVNNEINYEIAEVPGKDYLYVVDNGGTFTLINSGKKNNHADAILDEDKLKREFFKDLNNNGFMNTGGVQHLSSGALNWVPIGHYSHSKSGVWSQPSPSTEGSLGLYSGDRLKQYFLGLDPTDPTKPYVHSSNQEAADSFMTIAGATYEYNGSNYNTTTDIWNHISTNDITISDSNTHVVAGTYTDTVGASVFVTSEFPTEAAALNKIRELGSESEANTVKNKVYSEIDWEQTTDFTANAYSWIANNTVIGTSLKWDTWASDLTISLKDFMNDDKKYFEGITDYSWFGSKGSRPIFSKDNPDSTLWRAFRRATAFGDMDGNLHQIFGDGTVAYTCTGGTVTARTPFINSLEALWTDFGLHRARDFETELLPKMCENNVPIYFEKAKYSGAAGRGWYEDVFYSPWLLDELPNIVAPNGTPGYIPTVDEYRHTVNYVSAYNTWNALQPVVYIWNGTEYTSINDVEDAINVRIHALIKPDIIGTITRKKGLISNYPDSTGKLEIIEQTETDVISSIRSKVFSDALWTLQPGGTFTLKSGIDWNAAKFSGVGAPTSGYTEITNFITSKILSKYSKPGESAKPYDNIVAFDPDPNSRVVLHRKFNGTEFDIFEKVDSGIEVFESYIWDNLNKFGFSKQTQTGGVTRKIKLKVDANEIIFETLDEAIAYWENKVKEM